MQQKTWKFTALGVGVAPFALSRGRWRLGAGHQRQVAPPPAACQRWKVRRWRAGDLGADHRLRHREPDPGANAHLTGVKRATTRHHRRRRGRALRSASSSHARQEFNTKAVLTAISPALRDYKLKQDVFGVRCG